MNVSQNIDLGKVVWSISVKSGGDHIVGEVPSKRHALLFVDKKRVGLHFDVVLQPLLVLEQVLQGAVRLGQLVLHVLDAVHQLVDLLQQLAVRTVVAVLHLRTSRSLLQPRLGDPQRRVLCRY